MQSELGVECNYKDILFECCSIFHHQHKYLVDELILFPFAKHQFLLQLKILETSLIFELVRQYFHKNIKKNFKKLLTIIIPRHINRSDEIVNNLKKIDLKIIKHSSGNKLKKNTDRVNYEPR